MSAFLLDSLAAALILYSTGTALLHLCRLPLPWAIICAPPASLAVYSILGELYYAAGVPAGPINVCALPFGILLLLDLISRWLLPGEVKLPHISWRMLALYGAAGLLFGAFVFVRALPSPDAVFESEDISKHALQVQSFVDAKGFSSLHASIYLDSLDIAPFTNDESFYPCAWHELCALVVQLVGNGVPLSINACNYVLASLVYPLASLGMLAALFDDRPELLPAGALASMSFTAFPWALLVFGPLFPNLCGIACLPIVATFFILATQPDERTAPQRLVLMLCFLITSFGMAISHPNAVFSAAVMLIPYCCWLAANTKLRPVCRLGSPSLRAAVTFLLCAGVWVALRYSSAFLTVAAFNWAAFVSPFQSIFNALTLAFTAGFGDLSFVGQPLLALAVLLGAFQLHKDRRLCWLLVSYLGACLICMFCIGTEGELKHLLGGFWYTDPFRLAATAGAIGMPLATLGLWQLQEKLLPQLTRAGKALGSKASLAQPWLVYLLLAFVIVIPTFSVPGFVTLEGAYSNLHNDFRTKYSMNKPYSPEEREFVDRALELVGTDALVINDPLDGSILAYGFDDLNCYYRSRSGYAQEGETEESALIRERLDEISSDQQVRDAVESIGADYVILLNSRGDRQTFLQWYWWPKNFEGITSIDPSTPGFELVLEDDGMYLYRIAA